MVLNRIGVVTGIILFILVASACWTDLLFVNSAFNSYYALLSGAVMLSLVTIMSLRKRRLEKTPLVLQLYGLYVVYVLFHAFCFAKEYYYCAGILASYLMLFSLCRFFRQESFKRKVMNILLLFSVAESIVVLLQAMGCMNSLSPYFMATGTFENPNYTAIIIAFCFPIAIERVSQWNCLKSGSLCLVLMIVSLLMLRCRTAFVIAFVCLIIKIYMVWLRHKDRGLKLAVCGILMTIVVGLSYGLYKIKSKSSEGRLFIAEQTCRLIADHPIMGVGYGLFEKEYNMHVARLVEDGVIPKEEHKIQWVFTTYNEYLEQFAQGGIVGFLIFLLFVGAFCTTAVRSGSYLSVCFAVSVVVEMLFNFWQQAYPVLMVSALMISCIAAEDNVNEQKNNSRLVKWSLFFITLFLVGRQTVLTMPSQIQFASLRRNTSGIDVEEIINSMQSLKPYIGTSSSFYSCLGFCYLRERRIKDAKAVFQEAQDFTSVPDVYRGLYYSYRMQGNNEKAKQYKFYLDVMNIKIAEK